MRCKKHGWTSPRIAKPLAHHPAPPTQLDLMGTRPKQRQSTCMALAKLAGAGVRLRYRGRYNETDLFAEATTFVDLLPSHGKYPTFFVFMSMWNLSGERRMAQKNRDEMRA